MNRLLLPSFLLVALPSAQAADGCSTPPYVQFQHAESNGASVCEIDLTWGAATSACGRPVVYSVHRSTQRDFVPDAGNRVASCLASQGLIDRDVQPGAKYYYQVQVEDAADPGAPTCGAGNLARYENRTYARAAGGTETPIFSDDVEGAPQWTPSGSGAGSDFAIIDTAVDLHHLWYVADPAANSERLLTLTTPLNLPAGSASWFDFTHEYHFEDQADGGVLEYYSNGSWHDILDGDGAGIPADPDRIVAYGYDWPIDSSSSPLNGHLAWTSTSYSDFLPSRVDLSAMAGRSITLRFRFVSDNSVAAPGWHLDRFVASNSSSCVALSDVLVFNADFE